MDRLKISVCIMTLINLIFAEEIKSDSLYWNTNPLKRQRLFYHVGDGFSYGTNSMLLSQPATEGCFNAGCCLIPLTGSIMMGEKIFSEDTTKHDTLTPRKKGCGFGIGYSGGFYWTGEDLAKPFEASPIAGILQFPEYLWAHLYWLNSLYVSRMFSWKKNQLLEISLEYGWQKLDDRKGWWKYVNNAFDTTDGSLATLSSPELIKLALQFEYINNSPFSSGLEMIYSEARCKEILFEMTVQDSIFSYYWTSRDSAIVRRRCVGAGLFVKCSLKKNLATKITPLPFVIVKLSLAKEIDNNSPWNRWWNKQLCLNFTGISAGIKLNWGGVK